MYKKRWILESQSFGGMETALVSAVSLGTFMEWGFLIDIVPDLLWTQGVCARPRLLRLVD